MLNLTKQEQQAAVFLLSACLCGLAIKFWRKADFQPRILTSFAQNTGKVNLNRADFLLLKSISGIGNKTALRILEYRRQNSKFNNLDELSAIKGLSKTRLEKIRDSLYVD